MSDTWRRARALLHGASFAISVPEPRLLPPDEGREIAFAGRSNSGKSSAINALCGQRSLARTSRTPGRTQHLVVFDLAPGYRLVDLPGFGYAKVAKSVRAHWEEALPRYLEKRRALAGVVLLMDIRHPLKPQDELMIDWCAEARVPLHVLLNKADKLGRGPAAAARQLVARRLAASGAQGSVQVFSALRQQGLEEAFACLAGWFDLADERAPAADEASGPAQAGARSTSAGEA